MHLRSRTFGDAVNDQPPLASRSSSRMDENNSTAAVLGSPVTRRSWSTTHDSQDSYQNTAPVATNVVHPNPPDLQTFDSLPQTTREQHQYLTDYEIATHTEFEGYPTSIDSQELYTTSPPPHIQTHRPEEIPAYVQTTSSTPTTYGLPYIDTNPQTPTQPQPHNDYHRQHYTPLSNTPLNQPTRDPHQYQTPISQAPSRSLDYGQPIQDPSYPSYSQPSYLSPRPADALTTFPPFQPHQPHENSPQPSHLQTPTSTSDSLHRFVTSDNEGSWSPAAQTNPETHKRRISEADETVDGFRHNKLRKDLDEIAEGGEVSQSQRPRKRRRRPRGGKASGRPRSKPRPRSRSRDGGNGQGSVTRDIGGMKS